VIWQTPQAGRASRSARRRRLGVGLVAAAAVGLAIPAAASPAPQAATTHHVALMKLRLGSTGRTLMLPRDWSHLTVRQLAAYGLRPNQRFASAASIPNLSSPNLEQVARHGSVSTTTAVQEAPSADIGTDPSDYTNPGVQTDSASGCNDLVCIYVYGSGLTVQDWDASADNWDNADVCTYAAYWAPPNTIIATTNEVCGNGDFYAVWKGPLKFSGKTEICNTFVHFAGKPCETVHK